MATSPRSELGESAQRRERAAIAAQACQTCRNRKSKCDEQRPKCGLCRRLSVECVYREPLPTKKDKTMVHILDTLTRLETKFDNLAFTNGVSTPETTNSGSQTATASHTTSSSRAATHAHDSDYGTGHARIGEPNQHLTPPHKIMLWPSIYIYLNNSGIEAVQDLQFVLQQGTRWLIKLEMTSPGGRLSADVGLRPMPLGSDSPLHASSRVAFPELTPQRVLEYTNAYFDTFNINIPILDKDVFMADVVAPTMRSGFCDGDAASVLSLLVFALGQLAIEGVFERPISYFHGYPSGIRGGTATHPPGLDIFNEARRRVGFISTHMTLETVQIMLLQASYFAAVSSHLEFWRSTIMASMACQVLIKCQEVDWESYHGGLVKRAYWACNLSETFYHLDLDLPPSGIRHLEDAVPAPHFREGQDATMNNASASSDERSHFQYHFLAMIALRRLISRIHEVIHESFASQSESNEDYRGPPVTIIREMARQLDNWRSLLPRALQWQDNDRFDFPNIGPALRRPNESLFSPDQGHVPIGHKHNLDLVTAQLRSRFYYARFMLYRPFVYKALHFPELLTPDDADCCALAINSVLLWPMAMAPPKNKKRLIPDLFAWSQNFLGILLMLKMTAENDCLRKICNEHVNRDHLQRTTTLMLEWVRDVSQVDAIAAWGWKILEPLYSARP